MKKGSRSAKKGTPVARPTVDAEAQILHSFIELSYKSGARSVNHYQVAEHSGLAYTTIHYYFPPKTRDLATAAIPHMFKASFDYIEAKMYSQMQSNSEFDPIRSYVEVMFQWLEDMPAYASYLAYYYYLLSSQAEAMIPYAAFLEKAYFRIERYIHEAVGRQIYQVPKDVKALVPQIHGVIMGCCLMGAISRSSETIKKQKSICLSIIEKILIRPD